MYVCHASGERKPRMLLNCGRAVTKTFNCAIVRGMELPVGEGQHHLGECPTVTGISGACQAKVFLCLAFVNCSFG